MSEPTVELPVKWLTRLVAQFDAYDERRTKADALDHEGQVTDLCYAGLKGYMESARIAVEEAQREDGDANRP